MSMEGGTEPDIISGDDLTKQGAGCIFQAFWEASLTAWVMKPLIPTIGMKEGSRNEVELVCALPSFFEDHKGAYRRGLCSSTYSWDLQFHLTVKHVLTTGLVESRSCAMLADSPDASMAATDDDDHTTVYAVEIKTMAAVRTIEAASLLRKVWTCHCTG